MPLGPIIYALPAVPRVKFSKQFKPGQIWEASDHKGEFPVKYELTRYAKDNEGRYRWWGIDVNHPTHRELRLTLGRQDEDGRMWNWKLIKDAGPPCVECSNPVYRWADYLCQECRNHV